MCCRWLLLPAFPSPRLKTNNWQTRIRGSGKNCRSNGGWGGRRSSRGMLEMETQIQQFERDLMSASGFQEANPGKKAFSTETAARSFIRQAHQLKNWLQRTRKQRQRAMNEHGHGYSENALASVPGEKSLNAAKKAAASHMMSFLALLQNLTTTAKASSAFPAGSSFQFSSFSPSPRDAFLASLSLIL